MKKLLPIAITLLALAGCATPVRYIVENPTVTPASQEKVWQAIVEVFAENNIPIKTIDKASGIIAAEAMHYPDKYAECRFHTGEQIDSAGSFNVLVTKQDDGTTKVKVNARFTEAFRNGLTRNITRYDCESTNYMESRILKAVAEVK